MPRPLRLTRGVSGSTEDQGSDMFRLVGCFNVTRADRLSLLNGPWRIVYGRDGRASCVVVLVITSSVVATDDGHL